MAEKAKIREEAISRIKELTKKYELNPNILKYFESGKVYYSYLTAGGYLGSIDTITYEKRYEDAVKDFEAKHKGFMVYHAIEAETGFGTMLSLLYVGSNENGWASERLHGDSIMTYTVNFDYHIGEFGYIKVGRFGDSGALIRFG